MNDSFHGNVRRCNVCAGTGEVMNKSGNPKAKAEKCKSCDGTGDAADNIRKVMPQPKFDLQK